jgi:hypothetical protein
MSLGEILVVVLIAMIVTKPEDIPIIISKIQEFKLHYSSIKNRLLKYFTNDLQIGDLQNDYKNLEQLNFYLERIINIQGYYDGNYLLPELKLKYNELLKIETSKITREE